jgi:hypothetical protein
MRCPYGHSPAESVSFDAVAQLANDSNDTIFYYILESKMRLEAAPLKCYNVTLEKLVAVAGLYA